MNLDTVLNILSQYPTILSFYKSNQFFQQMIVSLFRYDIKEEDLQRAQEFLDINLLYGEPNRLPDLPQMFLQAKIQPDIAYGIAFELVRRLFLKFPEYFTLAEDLLAQWEQKKAQPFVDEKAALEKFMRFAPWYEDDSAKQTAIPVPEIPKKSIISLSLKKALEKYPRIINALLTEKDLVFRGSNGPVSPTLKNWITAYHQEAGSGTHEPFERSQFLFHNENATKLTQRERNILSEILRSLDETGELPINTDTQTIDFPSIEEKFSKEERMNTPPQTNSVPKNFQHTNSQRFSSSPASDQRMFLSPLNASANIGRNTFSTNTPQKNFSFQKKPALPSVPPVTPQTISPKTDSKTHPLQHAENKSPLSQSREDFTEYYPISKNQKSSPPSIAANISFSSPHTFPTEKEESSRPSSRGNTTTPIPPQIQKKKLLIG